MFGSGKLALALLTQHQHECAERYKAIQGELAKIQESSAQNAADGRAGRKGIYLLLWGIASAIILGLFAAVVWLLVNMVTWKVPVQ